MKRDKFQSLSVLLLSPTKVNFLHFQQIQSAHLRIFPAPALICLEMRAKVSPAEKCVARAEDAWRYLHKETRFQCAAKNICCRMIGRRKNEANTHLYNTIFMDTASPLLIPRRPLFSFLRFPTNILSNKLLATSQRPFHRGDRRFG